MEDKKLKILFISPEAVPFAKSGGLADVAGSLPPALKRLGIDVRLFMPCYRAVKDTGLSPDRMFRDIEIPLGNRKYDASLYETSTDSSVPVYLVHREDLYDRPNLYGDKDGDYYDNLERFSFLSHAVLIFTRLLKFTPDIVHCHDWQTGLIPALLKGPYGKNHTFTGSSTVFTIHNMGYQGIFPADRLSVTGLGRQEFFHPEGIEYWGNISLLKAGIIYSDAVTTVSPTYAQEIKTPEYGLGMEGILAKRSRSLHGILNGVDYHQWSPENDIHIARRYSFESLDLKKKCKGHLLNEMGLDPSLTDRPLLGIISRLDTQKGFDLLLEIIDDILSLGAGIAILGSGDREIQAALEESALRHKGKIEIHTGFNEPLAHRIMAGSDIFLIPSRYEPCGLTQMYALKYGTVPVVRATGGLNDTISEFDKKTGKGNGFKFGPHDSRAFLDSINKAVSFFQDKKTWIRIIHNGMTEDFSWDRSSRAYMEIYRSIKRSRSE